MSLRGGAYETLRNGVCTPNLCFLNARDQLYGGSADLRANHPVNSITNNDGDMLELTHVLAKDVGVLGVFSDWPATTTFYASCMMDRPKVTCGPNKPCPSGFECDGSRRARKLLFSSGPKGKGECVKAY